MKNSSLNAELEQLLKNGHVPHALFIEGATDKLRLNAAYEFARGVLCDGENPPCGRCSHCEKVKAKIHPDVILVEKQKDRKSIVAEQIRKMRSDAYIMPNEADGKVYIVRDGDEMSVTVQNLLLKLLEEPPCGVIIIMTGQSRSKLLPTVRSRLTTVSLAAVKTDKINEKSVRLVQCLAEKDSYEAMTVLTPAIKDRARGGEMLCDARRLLMLAFKLKSNSEHDEKYSAAEAASRSLTKDELLKLCDLLSLTESKLAANANQNLLSVWFGSNVDRIFN